MDIYEKDDTMLAVLITLGVLCGVLMLMVISICCYICARRYYIKKGDDVYDARFVAGHLWWTDNDARSMAGRQTMAPAGEAPRMMSTGGGYNNAGLVTTTGGGYRGYSNAGLVTKTSTVMVGCAPGGMCTCQGACKRAAKKAKCTCPSGPNNCRCR